MIKLIYICYNIRIDKGGIMMQELGWLLVAILGVIYSFIPIIVIILLVCILKELKKLNKK